MRFAVYRCRPVNIQDRVDHRQQRDQLGLCHWYRSRTARRQREPPHLQYRLAARTKNSCRLVLAVAIDKRKAPDSGVNLHGNIPGFRAPFSTPRRFTYLLCTRREHNSGAEQNQATEIVDLDTGETSTA